MELRQCYDHIILQSNLRINSQNVVQLDSALLLLIIENYEKIIFILKFCNLYYNLLIFIVYCLHTDNVTNKIVFPSDDQSRNIETYYSAAESKR